MDPILKHHYNNIINNKSIMKNGQLSTVVTTIMEVDGKEIVYPTLWDGQVLPARQALKKSLDTGTFVAFDTLEEAQAYDKAIHDYNLKPVSKEEAKQILTRAAKRPLMKERNIGNASAENSIN